MSKVTIAAIHQHRRSAGLGTGIAPGGGAARVPRGRARRHAGPPARAPQAGAAVPRRVERFDRRAIEPFELLSDQNC